MGAQGQNSSSRPCWLCGESESREGRSSHSGSDSVSEAGASGGGDDGGCAATSWRKAETGGGGGACGRGAGSRGIAAKDGMGRSRLGGAAA